MRPRRVDLFTLEEALASLDYCQRNIKVQQIYLDEDRKRNPQSDHEYSLWKLKEAHDDLRKAEWRVAQFDLPSVRIVYNRRA